MKALFLLTVSFFHLLQVSSQCVTDIRTVNTTGMYIENRGNVLNWLDVDRSIPQQILLMIGAHRAYRNYSDLEWLPFRNTSPFIYLCGWNEPSAVVAISVDTGHTILFIRELSSRNLIYDGGLVDFDEILKKFEIDEVQHVGDLDQVLETRWPGISIIHEYDSGLVAAEFPSVASRYRVEAGAFSRAVDNARVYKSDTEIALLRIASEITSDSEMEVMKRVEPGMTDVEVESLYRSFVTTCPDTRQYKAPTIASGINTNILHYNFWERTVQEDDIILMDCGPEYKFYYSDVTRTFPASGKFSEKQAKVYRIVFAGQAAALSTLQDGVSYGIVRRAHDFALLQGLIDEEFVTGTLQELYSAGVLSYFNPHGPSHGVGLDVHDKPGGMGQNFILRDRMVISMEPGIYFYRHVIDEAYTIPEIAQYMNFDLIETYMEFGGVRIEDVILITENGCENFSEKAPRSMEEIELLMANK